MQSHSCGFTKGEMMEDGSCIDLMHSTSAVQCHPLCYYTSVSKIGVLGTHASMEGNGKQTRKGREKKGRKRDDDVLIPVVYMLPINRSKKMNKQLLNRVSQLPQGQFLNPKKRPLKRICHKSSMTGKCSA
jgi:hypothetical protein